MSPLAVLLVEPMAPKVPFGRAECAHGTYSRANIFLCLEIFSFSNFLSLLWGKILLLSTRVFMMGSINCRIEWRKFTRHGIFSHALSCLQYWQPMVGNAGFNGRANGANIETQSAIGMSIVTLAKPRTQPVLVLTSHIKDATSHWCFIQSITRLFI